jgi:hypothetical protein
MIQRCAVECYNGMSGSARSHSSSSIDEASIAMHLYEDLAVLLYLGFWEFLSKVFVRLISLQGK